MSVGNALYMDDRPHAHCASDDGCKAIGRDGRHALNRIGRMGLRIGELRTVERRTMSPDWSCKWRWMSSHENATVY
jgi:hypothetical protein